MKNLSKIPRLYFISLNIFIKLKKILIIGIYFYNLEIIFIFYYILKLTIIIIKKLMHDLLFKFCFYSILREKFLLQWVLKSFKYFN